MIFPGNDGVVLVQGVVDSLDPRDSAGNPEYLDEADVAWQVLSDEYPNGVVESSGTGVWSDELGAFECKIPNAAPLVVGTTYWFRVTVTSGIYLAVAEDSFIAKKRTGRTAVT